MKKNYLNLSTLLFAIMTTFVLVLTSCNDDNETDAVKSPEEEADVNSAQIYEELMTQSLLLNLCEIDTLSDDSTLVYIPRRGKVLNDATPTVYYIGVDSLSEAEDVYFGIVSVLQKDENTPVTDYEVQQGNCHLSFQKGQADGEMARIEIECPTLSDVLTTIVFIPKNSWPENDAASPFNYLSLWKENKTGNYYLCVRKCEGDKGIMLSFDGGWSDDWFKKYDHWQGQFYLWASTATQDAFDCLCRAMRNNGTRYAKMLEKLKEQSNRGTKGQMFITLYEKLSPNRSITFDNHYNYTHGLWWFYNCYYLTLYKTTVYYNHTCAHWSAYYKHKSTPQKSTASHSFYFEADFDKTGWTCIFK